MKAELQAIADALCADAIRAGTPCTPNIDRARELSDTYVTTHLDEFTDHIEKVAKARAAATDPAEGERAAIAVIVKMCENLRNAELDEHWIRAEAFHLHHWHPQNVGGDFAPTVRNDVGAPPQVRNQLTPQ